MHSSPATNKSSVYCNGKKLASFTAKTSSGDTQITLGDIKKTGVNDSPFNGSIIFFSVYKHEKMTEKKIKFYHYVLCNSYNVNHDPINI